MHDFTAPWIGHHTAWGGAMYGNIARNFLVYGYSATAFGPVANFGLVDPASFDYYYHYPPLLVWLVSLSFHLFGVSEWSARLVPLLFSLIAVPLTFDLGRRLTGDSRVAILAALLMAAMPAGAYYGTHVDVYGAPAVTLTLLAFWGYVRWIQLRSRGALFLMCAGLVLGCMTAWYTYFAALLLLVHNLWLEDAANRFTRAIVAIVAAIPILVFGLFLAHRWSLDVGAHNEMFGTLWQKLVARTSYGGLGKPLWSVWAQHVRDTSSLYTPLTLVLCGAWLIRTLVTSRNWRPDGASGLLIALLGYGVLHNLSFPGLLPGHDFMPIAYAPGVAITSAITLFAAGDWIAIKSSRRTAEVLAITGGVVLVVVALVFTWKAGQIDNIATGARVKSMGESIQMSSSEKQEVVVPVAMDQVLQYYARREMLFGVSEPAALAALPKPKAVQGRIFAAAPQWLDERATLRLYLDEHYPRLTQLPLVTYDLSRVANASTTADMALPGVRHD